MNYLVEIFSCNALWPSDAIWQHRSWSTLAQIVAWCLTAPSQYLNKCWLLINEVLGHSPESSFAVSAEATIHYNEFENYTFKNTAASPRVQWVKPWIKWWKHPEFTCKGEMTLLTLPCCTVVRLSCNLFQMISISLQRGANVALVLAPRPRRLLWPWTRWTSCTHTRCHWRRRKRVGSSFQLIESLTNHFKKLKFLSISAWVFWHI